MIKKYYIQLLICVSSALLISCSDDNEFDPGQNIVPAKAAVSGHVMSYIDQTASTTFPREGVTVLLGHVDKVVINIGASDLVNQNDFVHTQTDANGYFEFKGLPPIKNWHLSVKCLDCVLEAQDASPDEEGVTQLPTMILVSLGEEEHDQDNNFIIKN